MCWSRGSEGTAAGYGVADIFISYTSADSDWAKWIAKELEALGHTPHVHEWEIAAGGDIAAWMEERHHNADHILCVVSEAYLKAPYSSWERRAAQWAATTKRPNFALPVFIEACEAPTLLASVKRCDLHGLSEDEARARLVTFLKPATKPSGPAPFPGKKNVEKIGGEPTVGSAVAFPGKSSAISNVPINVPLHFLGRDEDLTAIEAALKCDQGRVAITALHGLRGVGKTTLAAAYAERQRADYRATWWIRAETETTMRADLVGLGVRLNRVAADAAEEPALAAVLAWLRDEGDGILLIYDNANNPDAIRKHLPRSGTAKIIITSNAPNWGAFVAPVAIRIWPKEVGANYLIARTGRANEREAALALSEALGGLPLAHEQAAAYCERIGTSLAEYNRRFEVTPARLMGDQRDASQEYHDGLTVAATFALAIDEVAKLHPAAEPLITFASLLAPEPIPLYLFSEAREKFGEPLASLLADDGLDGAVAALRAFALVDRESIPDERDPSVATDCIRLHRLVRQVVAERCEGETRKRVFDSLVDALNKIYPKDIEDNPGAWPRARRLDAFVPALIDSYANPDIYREGRIAHLLQCVGIYRDEALAAYVEARTLVERALTIRERVLGAAHHATLSSMNSLGMILRHQGDFAGARRILERALTISRRTFGSSHDATVGALTNLALVLQDQGDLKRARSVYKQALPIAEKIFGPEHLRTGIILNNLAHLLQELGDFAGARPLQERDLAITEKVLGPEHPKTATSLSNLGRVLRDLGQTVDSELLFRRAITIGTKALGSEHPLTHRYCAHYARLQLTTGHEEAALQLGQAALAIHERVNGLDHPWTKDSARVTADALSALDRTGEADNLREKYNISG
jgi:tetratricopeptide (TPR) repeat protein